MSDATAPVRLDYRHVPLADQAALAEKGDGVFVALEAPPPVRTVLRAVASDGSVRALVVTRVVEVADGDAGGARGFYGRFVDDEALAKSDAVGSEHLDAPDGSSAIAESTEQGSGADPGSDVGNAAMAMPAPVLVDDEDEDSESGEDGADQGGTETNENGADADGNDAGASGSRRARKRRTKKPRK